MARPREYDDDLRVQLIETAARLLADEGPHAVTTRRVATEVGTSTTAIYSLLGSKAELFRANLPLIRLFFSETFGESFNLSAGLNYEIRRGHDESLRTLAAIFESGMKKQRFKRIADPFFLAVALDGITTAFTFRWLEAPDSSPFPEDPDTILNVLFQGLVEQR